jgi:hypothetical protein
MKKIILLASLILVTTVHGQKGSWYLGGSAGFSMGSTTQGSTTTKRSSWSFSPEVGTFLTNHIQLGLGITSSGATNDYPVSSSVKSIQSGGTIYSRYLFGEGAFKPFLGISASYLAGQATINPSVNKSGIRTLNAAFTAGFAYYITPRISVFGSIGVLGYTYSRTITSGVPDQITNDLGFNVSTLGNRFTIGMYYTFCKGKEKE